MLPDPLHPVVVHFPIALSALTPLFACAIWLGIRRGRFARDTWALVVLFNLLLVGSVLLAHKTGEETADRVEKIVDEKYVDEHANAADWLLWTSIASLVVSGAGLLRDPRGGPARLAAIAIAVLVLSVSVRVGHLGGQLVYKHGAARAYAEPGAHAQ